jgi:hypothetical protein
MVHLPVLKIIIARRPPVILEEELPFNVCMITLPSGGCKAAW